MAALSTTGCVGWGPCGNECVRRPFRGMLQGLCSTCPDDCGNCDGYNPPFGNVRRTLACGSGCGEIYYGEWASNPPNSCNDCDARGSAYGINSKYPWLCNTGWWRPWGVKYGQNGSGYGNPYRGSHPGMSDYGVGPGFLRRACMTDSCGGCAGCDSGCSTGGCAPNAPAGPGLQPIPSHSSSTRMRASNSMRVNYESPLIRSAKMRAATSNRIPARSSANSTMVRSPSRSPNSGTGQSYRQTSAVLRVNSDRSGAISNSARGGRLKQSGSLR